jgi:hypothetical protein
MQLSFPVNSDKIVHLLNGISDLRHQKKGSNIYKKNKRRKGGRENQRAGFIHEIIPVSTV